MVLPEEAVKKLLNEEKEQSEDVSELRTLMNQLGAMRGQQRRPETVINDMLNEEKEQSEDVSELRTLMNQLGVMQRQQRRPETVIKDMLNEEKEGNEHVTELRELMDRLSMMRAWPLPHPSEVYIVPSLSKDCKIGRCARELVPSLGDGSDNEDEEEEESEAGGPDPAAAVQLPAPVLPDGDATGLLQIAKPIKIRCVTSTGRGRVKTMLECRVHRRQGPVRVGPRYFRLDAEGKWTQRGLEEVQRIQLSVEDIQKAFGVRIEAEDSSSETAPIIAFYAAAIMTEPTTDRRERLRQDFSQRRGIVQRMNEQTAPRAILAKDGSLGVHLPLGPQDPLGAKAEHVRVAMRARSKLGEASCLFFCPICYVVTQRQCIYAKHNRRPISAAS